MAARVHQLTTRQRVVLEVLEFHSRYTAAQLGTRADVLWRLEERGLVSRNMHEQWTITAAGRAAIAG